MCKKQLFIFMLMLLYPLTTYANSHLIHFKGFLTTLNGDSVNRTMKLKFEIDNRQAELKVVIEKFVTITNGNIDTLLGRNVTLPYSVFDNNHFLALTVKSGAQYINTDFKQVITNKRGLHTTELNKNIVTTIDAKSITIMRNDFEQFDNQSLFSSCEEILYYNSNATDGVYLIDPDLNGELSPFMVYCDMNNGGWIVIQRRLNGKTDFNRNWEEYKDGFGSLKKEFWIGNENLNILTKSTVTLQINMKSNDDDAIKSATYSEFSVSDETEKYQLSVNGYSGTSGDSLSYHNNQYFSTKDRDNDQGEENCADTHNGGWWFDNCLESNLNGQYDQGIKWHTMTGKNESLVFVEMKIR